LAKRSSSRRRSSPRRKDPAPAVDLAPIDPIPLAEIVEHEPEVALSIPEPGIAARVPPPPPPRPVPDGRRAIFFDVENTSRAEHIARVIEHLSVDRLASRTDFIAVGNWRVIGHDTARLLARHGAQLVHSAPAVGVRDWSDLRIAVTAGLWMGTARAGDVIELVSDDRAFDAVGDVAATLGIAFRRLSFRRLAGMRTGEEAMAATPEPQRSGDSRGGHGRRRGRRGGRGRSHDRDRQMRDSRPAPRPQPSLPQATPAATGEPAVDPHSAPHDEMVEVIRALVARSSDSSVSIDTLANALKSRGFRRPPGSPRLITRLRRIREIAIDRTGRITMVDGSAPAPPRPVEVEDHVEPDHVEPAEPNGNRAAPQRADDDFDDGSGPGNERRPGEQPAMVEGYVPPKQQHPQGDGRRRRSRRGGRGRRRGRSGAPAAP
jgi:hypothetical protein